MSRPTRHNKWEARLEGVTALGPNSRVVVDKWMTAAITKATPILHAAVVGAAPAVTGRRVRPGIRQEVVTSGHRFTIPVIGRVWLTRAAIPVQTGARPHDIRARSGKTLRFQGRASNGRFAGIELVPVVHHRGTAPNDFFNRGIDAASGTVDDYLSAAADAIAKELAGK